MAERKALAKHGAGDGLDAITRAEDILLGSLGFGPEARIVAVRRSERGYAGEGVWADGESFAFESEGELDSLQGWALELLCKR